MKLFIKLLGRDVGILDSQIFRGWSFLAGPQDASVISACEKPHLEMDNCLVFTIINGRNTIVACGISCARVRIRNL